MKIEELVQWETPEHEKEVKDFLRETRAQAKAEGYREGVRSLTDCMCKEKWTFNVVHRKDNPCYLAPRIEEITNSNEE